MKKKTDNINPEIIENFLEKMELEELIVSPELSLKTLNKIDKKYTIEKIIKFIKIWFYGASFAIGLLLGVSIGMNIHKTETSEIAKIEETTLITEPIIVNIDKINIKK